MKKKNSDVATIENAVEATTITPTVEVTEPKKLGRPVNANSARQQKIAEMEQRKAQGGGYVKLGRPAVPGSKRQEKLAAIEAKKASGAVIQRGRPKMTEEQKADAKAKRDAAYEVWLLNQKNAGKTAAE
jgi:hypothetical protein